MYRLIIADDEESIREGLRDIVDWPGMGFEVVGVFADGREVLQFLGQNTADVILTDIRMTFVGGLEIAEYVHKNGLPTKVILISGYQEMEFAMSAIRYRVASYILKPVNLQELAAAFGKVRDALDEERQNRQYEETLSSLRQDMREVKEDFLSELVLGALKPGRYINSMLRMLYPGADPAAITWFSTTLRVTNCAHLSAMGMDSNELHRCITEYLAGQPGGGVEYHLRAKSGESFLLMGILLPGGEANSETTVIEAANRQLAEALQALYGMACTVAPPVVGHGVELLATGRMPLSKAAGPDGACPPDVSEQQKMIYTAMCTGNQEVVENVLDSFFEGMRLLPAPEKITAGLLESIGSRLREQGADLSGTFFINGGPLLADAALSFEERERGVREAVREVTGRIRARLPQEGDLIERAKKYIQENIAEDVSLESIADHFYMSQHYFSRVFKTRTGENLIDFIVRSKMEYAIKLLAQEHLKVYEVSHMAGYKSVRYFTQRFKEYSGYTPNAYRQLLRGAAPKEQP